jgi:hypothetical protein
MTAAMAHKIREACPRVVEAVALELSAAMQSPERVRRAMAGQERRHLFRAHLLLMPEAAAAGWIADPPGVQAPAEQVEAGQAERPLAAGTGRRTQAAVAAEQEQRLRQGEPAAPASSS